MNRIVLWVPLAIFGLSALLSVLVHIQNPSSDANQRSGSDNYVDELAANNWKEVLQTLPQYKKPEVASRLNNAQNKTNSKPKPTPKPPRQPQINDAVLIGVVLGEPKQAILLNKKPGAQPIYLSEGQSWLSGWQIEKIDIDRLVWVNPQTSEKQTQFLFGKS